MPASAPAGVSSRMKGSPVNSTHDLAQQAEGRLVVVAEEGADRDEGEHHRRQHQDQQEAPAGELALEQQRQQEAHDHLQR